MGKIEKIARVIKKFNSFLIASHVNPEGDSLGSQLALANLLKCLGKRFFILNHDKIPVHYRFLPRAGMIKNVLNKKNRNFDVAMILDCPNLKRTGKVKAVIKNIPYIVNIDHHVSNEKFGDINWVEENTSSVGEMIYRLYRYLGCGLSREIALSLYISILTDTGSFNYNNTSSATHKIISELLGYGIEPYNVSKNVYENKTLGDIRLLGKALSGIKTALRGKIAYMTIDRKLFKETKTGPAACENFVNFARSINGVRVAVFFREDSKKDNTVHVSFRSGEDADVNKIARFFGGGGHKNASGCTVAGTLTGVKNKVLKKIKDEL